MKRLILSVSLIISTATVFADQGGTSTAAFLRIGQGARAEGMGGAFTAVADDAHAIHFNPAGLAQITQRNLALDHLEFIEDIKSEYAAYVQPFNQTNGSLGAEVTFVDMGTIERLDSSGSAAGGDNQVGAQSAALAWGQAIGDRLALGVTGRYISQDLAGEKSSAFAGDGGILFFLTPNKFAVGASIQNFGAKMKVGTTDEDLPLTYRVGGVFYVLPQKLMLAADVEKERDTDSIIHLGGEYIYMSRFAVRAGYRDTLEAKGGFSAGASYIWHPGGENSSSYFSANDKVAKNPDEGMTISFDYAFVDYGDFDATHRIGVRLSF